MKILTKFWKLRKIMKLGIKIFLIVFQNKVVRSISRKVSMGKWQRSWKKEFRKILNSGASKLNRRCMPNSILSRKWKKIILIFLKKIIIILFKKIMLRILIQRQICKIVKIKFKLNKNKLRKIWINKYKKLSKRINNN